MRLLFPFVLTVAACGSGPTVGANPGCDRVGDEYGFNQVHSCTEVPSDISPTDISKEQSDCTKDGGGTWVAQCSHSASGSCQFYPTVAPAVLLTEWYLSGNAQDAMTICEGKGGTFKTQ
jgi:hypothetical protein